MAFTEAGTFRVAFVGVCPSLASERSSMDIVTSLVEWVGDDSDYVFNEHESIGVKEGA